MRTEARERLSSMFLSLFPFLPGGSAQCQDSRRIIAISANVQDAGPYGTPHNSVATETNNWLLIMSHVNCVYRVLNLKALKMAASHEQTYLAFFFSQLSMSKPASFHDKSSQLHSFVLFICHLEWCDLLKLFPLVEGFLFFQSIKWNPCKIITCRGMGKIYCIFSIQKSLQFW